MSKTSNKQRYIQLKEWMSTFRKINTKGKKKGKKVSRSDYYKSKGVK